MDAGSWVLVVFAIIVAGGGMLPGLALAIIGVRAGRGPVATLALATALCLGFAVLLAFLLVRVAVFT